jgi:hypothetical protein
MDGETELARLLAGMEPRLDPQAYVFVELAGNDPPRPADAIMAFRETEGWTSIRPAADDPGDGDDDRPRWRRITLTVHSSLEAVGFLAALLPPLAAAQIPVNCVSALHHDHLFVPAGRAREALEILKRLSEAAAQG